MDGRPQGMVDLLHQNGRKGLGTFEMKAGFLELFGKSSQASGAGLSHDAGRYRGQPTGEPVRWRPNRAVATTVPRGLTP